VCVHVCAYSSQSCSRRVREKEEKLDRVKGGCSNGVRTRGSPPWSHTAWRGYEGWGPRRKQKGRLPQWAFAAFTRASLHRINEHTTTLRKRGNERNAPSPLTSLTAKTRSGVKADKEELLRHTHTLSPPLTHALKHLWCLGVSIAPLLQWRPFHFSCLFAISILFLFCFFPSVQLTYQLHILSNTK
jgi:hypothetical protein